MIALARLPTGGLGPDRGAQHVAGRELRNAVLSTSRCACVPLPAPGGPSRISLIVPSCPPSFDFLISPSYWWASRWPWICATVSMVTFTTISSEVPPK